MTIEVLHVIARMNIGGTARYVSHLVKDIPNSALATGNVQGLEVEDSSVLELRVFKLNHLGRKISIINDIRSWLELRQVIRNQQPQIVHTHTFKAGLIGRLVRGPHKRVHTFHGHLLNDDSFSTLQKSFIIFVERQLARRTDLLISVGVKVGIELQAQKIGLNRTWVSVQPGIDPIVLIDKGKARALLGIQRNEIYVGWMARMAEVKNPFMLLDIAKKMPHVNFIMAGGGELLDSVKTAAPKNIKVIGWADSTIFWSAVDFALSTSDNEGMPIALIEAQLAGLPVVATDVGSTSEVVENGVTGIIIEKNLGSAMQAIELLRQNVPLRISMGEKARTRSKNLFGLQNMVDKHINNYQILMSNRSK